MYEIFGIKLIKISSDKFFDDLKIVSEMVEQATRFGLQILWPIPQQQMEEALRTAKGRACGFQIGIFDTERIFETCKSETQIEFLNIAENPKNIDLSAFENLKYYYGPWPNVIREAFDKLEVLSIDFSGNRKKNITFPEMPELRILHLKNAPVENLSGICSRNIEEIDLYNCKYLSDISNLWNENIEVLNIERCKNLSAPSNFAKIVRFL